MNAPADTIEGAPADSLAAPSGAAPGAWRRRLRVIVRLFLVLLSAGGVVAALALWLTGQGPAAARLLAGDVLLIFVILLAL